MFHDKILQSVANAVKDVMAEQLKGDQHKIDKNKNGKVDAHDFKLLRKEEAPKKPASPFDWKNTPRQTAEKGEKTGHDSKKISTGTVYTKKYTKEEASQAEFNAEIKKAQDKSTGKVKAEVAKPAVQAVQTESTADGSKPAGEKTITVKHKTSGKELRVVATAKDRYQKMGYEHVKEEVAKFDALKHIKNPSSAVKAAAKDVKRSSYADRAALMKAGGVKDDRGPRGVTKEDVEQIDELKKSTLGSYIKKASHDVAHKGAMTRQHANDSEAAKKASNYSDARKSMEKADKTFAKSWKRREGMAKATDRLTKEEVEINERSLTSGEKTEMEKNVKGMKKNLAGFKERYGSRAKEVMYATATKIAKKD